MTFRNGFLSTCALLLAMALAGCGRHDHESEKAQGGHAHAAPHGGVLVEVGEHAFNLEFVADRAAGMLRCYVLDGHAVGFVRIAQASIHLEIPGAGGMHLAAVADERTGETVGDTAHFAAPLGALPAGGFDAVVGSLSIRGHDFPALRFHLQIPSDETTLHHAR